MENQDRFFNNDVQYMHSLIGRSVEITTLEDNYHKGFVYVIDPVTKTVVLTNKKDQGESLDFIMYDCIKSFVVTSDIVVREDLLFINDISNTRNTEDLENTKQSLKRWLKQNLIDIQEDGPHLKLNDELIIEPPYGPEQCLCSNVIVLDRIRKIIAEMPVNNIEM